MHKCIFCDIVLKLVPAEVVFEDNNILVILDTDPISAGHCLVIPKEHIKDYLSIRTDLGGLIMNSVGKIASAIMRTYPYDGTMITSVSGQFQDVAHLHIHVFGREKKRDIQINYPIQNEPMALPARIAADLRANLV